MWKARSFLPGIYVDSRFFYAYFSLSFLGGDLWFFIWAICTSVNAYIVSASFWWALSVGTKWSGRSGAVWAQRVCGAHSETKWRSSSADAALTSLVLSGSSQKERTITWSFGSFASRQKNRYEHQIQYQNQLFLYLHFQLFLFNLPYFSIGKENCCLGGADMPPES